MKYIKFMLVLSLLLGFVALPAQEPSEVDQLKSDLIGHYMGGRDRGWKFQSADQIESLEIENTSQSDRGKVYTVTLILHDRRTKGKYEAVAEVVYQKEDDTWKLHYVALKSMKKIE